MVQMRNPTNTKGEKSVLVTGASSGIGRAITEYLAGRGFFVFAGARSQQAIDELDSLENVIGVRLDVTSVDDLQVVFDTVKERKIVLFGLVNNAAVAVAGAFADLDVGLLRKQFEVNVFGQHQAVRGFLPMLRETKGRIVNISSIAGLLVVPYICAYVMSKYALEAYSEGLARELEKYEIKVSIVEPGDIKTSVVKKIHGAFLERAERKTDYTEEYKQMAESFIMSLENRPDPVIVAEAVFHALSSEVPHSRYVVGSKNEEKFTFSVLLSRILEINEGLKEKWSFEEINRLLTEVRQQRAEE